MSWSRWPERGCSPPNPDIGSSCDRTPLTESFSGVPAGAFLQGPRGRGLLGDWEVEDHGDREGPSRWEVRQEGNPPSRFIVQTSNVWGPGGGNSGAERPGTVLIRGELDWSDYALSAVLRSGDDDGIGLVFRYRSETDFYRFSFNRGRSQRRLVRSVGGAHAVFAEDGFVYEPNRDYRIAVELVGPRIRAYQDGELIFEVNDPSHASGRVGLYAWGNTDARFSHVRVDDLGHHAPSVYSFGFVTSRYANFAHPHVQLR